MDLALSADERAIQEALECDGVCILSGSWRSEEEQLHLFVETRRPMANSALADAVRATLAGFSGVHIHVVDALPRTPNGKIRRIGLEGNGSAAILAPTTAVPKANAANNCMILFMVSSRFMVCMVRERRPFNHTSQQQRMRTSAHGMPTAA